MCRHCRDTQQVHPWKLGHDVHVMDGHGRIYTRLEKRTFCLRCVFRVGKIYSGEPLDSSLLESPYQRFIFVVPMACGRRMCRG
ncbi:hypothetical protein ACVBIL_10155 [Shewanella sp. 125m-7]